MKYIKPTLLILFLLVFLLTAVSCSDAGENKPGTSTPTGTKQPAQLTATDSGDVTEAPTESRTDYDEMDTDNNINLARHRYNVVRLQVVMDCHKLDLFFDYIRYSFED